MNSDNYIDLVNVTRKYVLGDQSINALNEINFSLKKGDFVTITGTSGSGKSTFLNILGCIDKPTSGKFTFNNKNITEIPLEKLNLLRLHEIGYIFQSFNLIPVLNVFENVELPLLYSDYPKKKIKERVEYIIEKVGLKNRINHKPNNLSGGQRQRVAIARALVGNPSLIIADEPTANLDGETTESILRLIKSINERDKVTVIMASHDQHVIDLDSRKIRMDNGCIFSD